MALFTNACLLTPSPIHITSVGDLLIHISSYIYNAWGVNIDADAMDLRWSDCTGDTFALGSHQIITRLTTLT
jgi:hypothetical protein